MTSRLYIAAKAPRPLVSKTRLGSAIGHERAARIYAGFLCDLGRRFYGFAHEVGWFVPPGAWPEILAVLGPAWSGARVVHQTGADWGERQRGLFAEAALRGEEKTVLVGSDIPHLDRAVVADAFRALDSSDVVFGPVIDGGYYLIGMRGYHDVLDGVPMSTGDELGGVIARCDARGLRHCFVDATFDVDEMEDLDRLRPLAWARPDLAATRAALSGLVS